ncbi:MAG: hypothetical protein AB7E61_06675 [Acholeplasmataceae bacterium]
MKLKPRKKGTKVATIFGGIVGLFGGILMAIEESFKAYVFNHIWLILIIIGFIGGCIGVLYWYMDYKKDID